jgi:hypothetical protein
MSDESHPRADYRRIIDDLLDNVAPESHGEPPLDADDLLARLERDHGRIEGINTEQLRQAEQLAGDQHRGDIGDAIGIRDYNRAFGN